MNKSRQKADFRGQSEVLKRVRKKEKAWTHLGMCTRMLSPQLYLMLCDPMNCSPLGSSVHGIFQERILEWVTISISRRSSQSKNPTCILCIGRQILYHWATREALSPLLQQNWMSMKQETYLSLTLSCLTYSQSTLLCFSLWQILL